MTSGDGFLPTVQSPSISHLARLAALQMKVRPIHGDRFHIWAASSESETHYNKFETEDYVAVGPSGYLTSKTEAEEEVFNFAATQASQ